MLKIVYGDNGQVKNIVMAMPGEMAHASAEWVASKIGLLYTDVSMLAERLNDALMANDQVWEEVADLEESLRAVERQSDQWEQKYHISLLETAVNLNGDGATYIEFTSNMVGEDLGIRKRHEVKTPKGIRRFTSADVARWLYDEGWRWLEGEYYNTPVPPSADVLDDCPF